MSDDLLEDFAIRDLGHRYLIQRSAGSGQSNSIAWLAHQLTNVTHKGALAFDAVIIEGVR